MTVLERWYAHIDAANILSTIQTKSSGEACRQQVCDKAVARSVLEDDLPKLATVDTMEKPQHQG